MLRRAEEIYGLTIEAVDGEAGNVHDLYLDDQTWIVRYLVADTGGWLRGRRVLLSPVAVEETDWDAGKLHVDLTRSQVEHSPHIDLDKPVSRQQIVELHEYYGWPAFWGGSAMVGTATPVVYPMIMAGVKQLESEMKEHGPSEKHRGDPHLRSARAVAGYDTQAVDGEIGHLEDYFVDGSDWVVRYMLVNARDMLPGREVLISPTWIQRVNWADQAVYVALTQDQIKSSPEYIPAKPPDRDYEAVLHEHYGVRAYWRE